MLVIISGVTSPNFCGAQPNPHHMSREGAKKLRFLSTQAREAAKIFDVCSLFWGATQSREAATIFAIYDVFL